MAIAGALIGGALGAFGKKPTIPDLPPIDINQVQQQAIAANQKALPGAQNLVSDVNAFNQSQLQQLMEKAFPGASTKIKDTINSMLAGEIPAEVSAQIQRSGAERAVAGGFQDTGFGRNLVARDLGLTSLQLTQQGISSAEKWLSMSTAPMADVSAMFVSPQQRLAFTERERAAQYNRNLLANQVEAAPDPATAALGQEIDRFFNTAAGAGMMAAGGAMGGGGMGAMGGMGGLGGGGGAAASGGFGMAGGKGVGIMQSNLNGSNNFNSEFGYLSSSGLM